MTPTKIFYISYDTGFLSIHANEIIQNMIKSGATVDLFIANNARPDFDLPADCIVHRIPVPFRHAFLNIGVFQFYLCLVFLMRLFLTGKPDLIYARQNFTGFPVILLARLWKLAYFAEINGIVVRSKEHSISFKQRMKTALEWVSLKLANVVIVPSETLKQRLLDRYCLPAEKIFCVPNGCNEILFSPGAKTSSLLKDLDLKDQDFIVGFIGSMGEWQGIEILKDAIKSTVALDSEIKFLLVGDYIKDSNTAKLKAGNCEAAADITEFIRSKGLEQNVIYHNFVSYPSSADYMILCDILVAPYTVEYVNFAGGSPMKLYAYLGCGKAVIISNLNDFTDAEALKKNNAAYLVPPNDCPALVDAIIELKSNETLRLQLGRNGRDFVLRERRWSHSCAQIMDIYHQKLNQLF